MSAARDKVIGSTMRNIAGMHPMGTGKPRISTAAAEPAGRVVQVELALGRVLAELELVQVLAELALGPVLAELEHVQVQVELALGPVLAELEHDPVAVEPEHGPAVVPELVIGQVAGELEHVQEEAELELVRAAVPLRTKSVITPHHRGLVPLLGAEDLAAEVETTREPAAAEAVIAWEVAE